MVVLSAVGILPRTLRAGVGALAILSILAPLPAGALSSGGYSRPSVSRPSVRTPSTSTFSRPSPSSSFGSGGYQRPRDRTPSVLAPSTSAGDVSISRRNSGDALDALRRRQADERAAADRRSRESAAPPRDDSYRYDRPRTPDVPRRRRREEVDDAPSSPWPAPYPRRRYDEDRYGGSYDTAPPRRTPPVRPRWAGDPSWQAPSWVDPRVDAGTWNPMFLWFMLDTLSRPGHGEWFRQHRSDPGYASWRRSADAAASGDPALRSELAELDRTLGAPLEAPADPSYLPPGVSKADASASEGIPAWPFLLATLLVVAAGGGWILFTRRRRRPSAMSGPTLGRLADVAQGAARNALGKPKDDTRQPFRVGQVIALDATPFILGSGKLVSQAPDEGKPSVTAIGRLDGLPLTRLYLQDGRFLQVHLSDNGRVDECRLFNPLDVVSPGSPDEWAFWLPPGFPGEGGTPEWAIGFPVFEDKEGRRWDRVWSPGGNQVEPFEAKERREGGPPPSERSLSAMLYARATGVAEPGPGREYLLLTAVTEGREARVEIHVGIDVDTAGLDLTA